MNFFNLRLLPASVLGSTASTMHRLVMVSNLKLDWLVVYPILFD
jgi:hypothetical protein